MCDFEHSLRTAIKNNIKGINLRGCYFHYAKAIYKRCKSYGLFTKKKKRDTIFIAFILKLYPYIPTKLRKDYMQKIESYIKNFDKGYHKLLAYFNKDWVDNKFFNFSEINNDDIIKRTNNICESYHGHLNNTISHFHPKLSFLLNKLKEDIFNKYKKFHQSLYKKIDCNIEKFNVYDDIYNFMKQYKNIVKENLDINNFINNFDKVKNEVFNVFKSFIILYMMKKIIFLKIF